MYVDEYKIMFEYEDHYWWYRALHELIEFFVKKEKRNKKRFLNILDAGCGTGKLLTILQQYGNTCGIDYSEDAIMYCKKRGLKNIQTGDLCDYQLNPSQYDIITHIDILCCVKKENEIGMIKKFHDALKPGGILILNLPAFQCLRRRHDIAVGSHRRYRRNIFIPQLVNIGFNIEIQSYRLPILFIPILFKKYFEVISNRKKIRSDFSPLPFYINWSLLQLIRVENKVIDRMNIPFGSSLFIVARKR